MRGFLGSTWRPPRQTLGARCRAECRDSSVPGGRAWTGSDLQTEQPLLRARIRVRRGHTVGYGGTVASRWDSAGHRGRGAVGTGEAAGAAHEGRQPPRGLAGRPAGLWVSMLSGCTAPGRGALGTRQAIAVTL